MANFRAESGPMAPDDTSGPHSRVPGYCSLLFRALLASISTGHNGSSCSVSWAPLRLSDLSPRCRGQPHRALAKPRLCDQLCFVGLKLWLQVKARRFARRLSGSSGGQASALGVSIGIGSMHIPTIKMSQSHPVSSAQRVGQPFRAGPRPVKALGITESGPRHDSRLAVSKRARV